MSGQRDLERDFLAHQNMLLEKQKAEEMTKQKSEEKKVKRTEFLLDILKAVIVAAITLFIEHFIVH